jgi:hypothetical protein
MPPLEALSASFSNYADSLNIDIYCQQDNKGKKPLMLNLHPPAAKTNTSSLWIPPPIHWIKVNIDASFMQDSGVATAGLVARDHRGAIVISGIAPLRACSDAEEAEALACLEGHCGNGLCHTCCRPEAVLKEPVKVMLRVL